MDDQEKALKYYTQLAGFVTKSDIPFGVARWLTVVSPQEQDGPELVLEPDGNPVLEGALIEFKKALFRNEIPLTAFAVDDIHAEVKRMKKLGVAFVHEPATMGQMTQAVFDDTCGNLIQIYQVETAD